MVEDVALLGCEQPHLLPRPGLPKSLRVCLTPEFGSAFVLLARRYPGFAGERHVHGCQKDARNAEPQDVLEQLQTVVLEF